jgi:hypothetical protein
MFQFDLGTYRFNYERQKSDRHTDTSELEKAIDDLVYQLYGLTEEEIKIVEGER